MPWLTRNSMLPLGFAIFYGLAIYAGPARADDFRGLSTPSLELMSQHECLGLPGSTRPVTDDDGNPVQQGLFPWAPSGVGRKAPYPGCGPDSIREAFLSSSSPSQQAANLRRLIGTCDASWLRNDDRLLESLFDLSQVRYDFCRNSRIRPAIVRLQDGAVLRGYLALKPGRTPRPLVIVRCGLLCNAGDISHRFLMTHLFDASPFNVLAVANVTGSDFVRDNHRISIGGLEEGAQFQEIARIVAKSTLARLTSSYHLVSVSLGAQGVLYASTMNPYARGQGTPAFASGLALCPVVDLQPTAKNLFSPDWKGRVAKRVFFDDVYEAIASIPGLRVFFPRLQADQIPDEVANAAVARLASMPAGWAPRPFQATQILSRDDFWKAHRFMEAPIPSNAVPTLALASDDDWIVETSLNAARLSSSLRPGGPINVAIAPHGNHCAFGVSYGWEVATEIYRSWILSRSPEFLPKRRWRQARIDSDWLAEALSIGGNQAFARFEFSARVGSPALEAAAWIWDPYLPAPCPSAYDAQRSCVWSRRFLVPLERFDGASWARVPTTSAEAEALARFANTNLRFVDESGRPSFGQNRPPRAIVWESFDD